MIWLVRPVYWLGAIAVFSVALLFGVICWGGAACAAAMDSAKD